MRKNAQRLSEGERQRGSAWNSSWYPLSRATTQWIITQLEHAATTDPVSYCCLNEALQETACLEFPTGELLNTEISGYMWAWGIRKMFSPPYKTEESKHSFACQGLEGLIRVAGLPLSSALTTAMFINMHRVGISVRTDPTSIAARVRELLAPAERLSLQRPFYCCA
jgi:hypothetical protein